MQNRKNNLDLYYKKDCYFYLVDLKGDFKCNCLEREHCKGCTFYKTELEYIRDLKRSNYILSIKNCDLGYKKFKV